ncbi:MAG: cytidine deaminase [Anaerolineales bacterium]|nr:cytidine deaminase [Anaerolineales bacterium]
MITIQQAIRNQLAQLPAPGRPLLAQITTAPSFAGVIPAAQARTLATQMDVSIEVLMHTLVPLARCFAYTPISNYNVGTIVRGASGNLYLGANLEFLGLGLNLTIHGEQAAVVNARLHGETGLAALSVQGTPCGHCRQFLAEINNPDFAIIYADGHKRPLTQVLPHAFSPMALGNAQGLFDPPQPRPQWTLNTDDPLSKLALQMAQQSYAPYSKNWAGIAVQLTNGFVAGGPYLENVAFNPSLSPLQTALVALRMAQQSWQDIQDAVLVEQQASLSSHTPASRALLATFGTVELRYHAL